jgi:hypothetical protein
MALNNQYPLKYGVLYALIKTGEEMSLESVMEMLKPVFGKEKQFTKKNIRFHLDSMTCTGMAEMFNERFDEDGNVTANFKVTPFGIERSNLLPDEWQIDLGVLDKHQKSS